MNAFTGDDLKRNEPKPNKRIKASERWANSFDKIPDGCWNWKAVIGSNGYGRFWFNGKLWLAHRWAWLFMAGQEIPDGLVLDHTCRNRRCVNIKHLRPITSKENTLIGEGPTAKRLRRGTCDKGHPYTEGSTRINKKTGGRQCELCRKVGHLEWLNKNQQRVKDYRKKVWATKGV